MGCAASTSTRISTSLSSDTIGASTGTSRSKPCSGSPRININRFVDCSACGYVGEGEHFPAFRARSGSGGSGAGRQSRSSTYPQAFLVDLARRAIAEALVLAFVIVKAEPNANAGLRLSDRRIGMEVDLLVFQAAPQPLDKDVVHAAALAVHADRDPVVLQGAGEDRKSTRL